MPVLRRSDALLPEGRRGGLKPLEIVETAKLRLFLRWLQVQRIRTFAARRQKNGLWSVRVGWQGRRRVRRMGPEGAYWAVTPADRDRLEPKAKA